MPPMSKIELYAVIRCDARAGLAMRALPRRYGVGFRTVQRALESAWPEPRKKPQQRATRLDAYKPLIDQMLRADLDAPCKQRHTTKRIFDRLVTEHDAGELTYGIVRAYVARRRPEVRVEAGRDPPAVFVPQSHRPGVEAEVDFGDVTVRLPGAAPSGASRPPRSRGTGPSRRRAAVSGVDQAGGEGRRGDRLQRKLRWLDQDVQ